MPQAGSVSAILLEAVYAQWAKGQAKADVSLKQLPDEGDKC